MMTKDEAIIARVVTMMVHGLVNSERDITCRDALNLTEAFIKSWEPRKPCRYDHRCVLSGQCPFDPVCNN